MTGEAIGQAIRLMKISTHSNLAGALFVVLSHLLCLFIWWRALRASESTPLEEGQREVALENLETHSSLPR
jgi:hypothetical protein